MASTQRKLRSRLVSSTKRTPQPALAPRVEVARSLIVETTTTPTLMVIRSTFLHTHRTTVLYHTRPVITLSLPAVSLWALAQQAIAVRERAAQQSLLVAVVVRVVKQAVEVVPLVLWEVVVAAVQDHAVEEAVAVVVVEVDAAEEVDPIGD